MSQGQASIPARGGYGGTSKLPDRTAYTNNPSTYGQTTYQGRRPDQPYQYQQAPAPPQHGATAPRASLEKDSNALSELDSGQRQEVDEAFGLFDLDRDRQLDYHELKCSLRALGIVLEKTELVQIMNTHGILRPSLQRQRPKDARDQHPLHISQLVLPHHIFARISAQKIIERDPRTEVDRAYEMFDNVGKGYIDIEDLRRVARELEESNLEEEELRAMIEEFDYDGQGTITRESFHGICLTP